MSGYKLPPYCHRIQPKTDKSVRREKATWPLGNIVVLSHVQLPPSNWSTHSVSAFVKKTIKERQVPAIPQQALALSPQLS
jgi:hypothetical protein